MLVGRRTYIKGSHGLPVTLILCKHGLLDEEAMHALNKETAHASVSASTLASKSTSTKVACRSRSRSRARPRAAPAKGRYQKSSTNSIRKAMVRITRRLNLHVAVPVASAPNADKHCAGPLLASRGQSQWLYTHYARDTLSSFKYCSL